MCICTGRTKHASPLFHSKRSTDPCRIPASTLVWLVNKDRAMDRAACRGVLTVMFANYYDVAKAKRECTLVSTQSKRCNGESEKHRMSQQCMHHAACRTVEEPDAGREPRQKHKCYNLRNWLEHVQPLLIHSQHISTVYCLRSHSVTILLSTRH
jgi:hypothetical protein